MVWGLRRVQLPQLRVQEGASRQTGLGWLYVSWRESFVQRPGGTTDSTQKVQLSKDLFGVRRE